MQNNRRQFLSTLVAGAIAAIFPARFAWSAMLPKRHVTIADFPDYPDHATSSFGFLDVDRALQAGYLPAHVFLNGKEINDVVTLNDREGWVEILERDDRGHYIADHERMDAKRTLLRGAVLYVPHPNGVPGKWAER
jgi:hypothetical protein